MRFWCGCYSVGREGLHRHGSLAGGGVHQEVFEEDLRGAGAQDTMLGLVGGLDVDGIGAGLLDVQNLDSLAVTTGDTIALAFGCLDDEVDASVVGEFLVRGELLLL